MQRRLPITDRMLAPQGRRSPSRFVSATCTPRRILLTIELPPDTQFRHDMQDKSKERKICRIEY